MKTLTEFVGISLKNVLQAQQALVAAGKTPEEIPAALTEQFKVEGDKLKYLTTAAEVAKNRLDGLKRVVVMQLAENEKAPMGAEKHEELYYVVEHFAKPEPKGAQGHGRDDRGGRGDKRGGRGGKGGGRDSGRGGPGGFGGGGGGRGERSAGGRGERPGAGPGRGGPGGGAPAGGTGQGPKPVIRPKTDKPAGEPQSG